MWYLWDTAPESVVGLDLVTLFLSQEILETHFAGSKHFPFLSLQTGFPSTSPHCPGHCGGLWEAGQSPGWKGHGQGTRVTGEGLGGSLWTACSSSSRFLVSGRPVYPAVNEASLGSW